MTDDVRIATSLRGHRKTRRLKRHLGEAGCWSLVCLFLFAGEQRWTGDLSGMTDEDIEEESDWNGDPGALVSALVKVKFIVGESLARQIHQWQEHNPYAAAKTTRIEKGRAAATARWAKERGEAPSMESGAPSTDTDACSNDQACPVFPARTPEQCPPAPTPTPTPAPAPSHALTPPLQTVRARADALGFAVTQESHAAALASILVDAGMKISANDHSVMIAAAEGVSREALQELVEVERGKPATDILALAVHQVRRMRERFPNQAAAMFGAVTP